MRQIGVQMIALRLKYASNLKSCNKLYAYFKLLKLLSNERELK